jgi:MFS family permease
MLSRNIWICYFLAFSRHSWFWLGIWVFYYLKFTNYAGIGLIETILILTMTLIEIPSGAVADMLGKKWTLFAAFLIQAIGAVMMAYTSNFFYLGLSVFVLSVGATFYSGTLEALACDTLKEKDKKETYDKVIANINSISLVAPAICSIIGGYIYLQNPGMPFLLNGLFYFLALIACIFITEPNLDTEKFSLKNYVNQTKQGFRELTKTSDIKKQTLVLLSIAGILVITGEMIDSFLGVEFGFKPEQLGILSSVIFLIGAAASQFYPYLKRKLDGQNSPLLIGALTSLTFIISPFVGTMLGGLSLIVRTSLVSVFNNLRSETINANTESKYRATTISTFNLLQNIPYVLTALLIGSLADTFSARTMALVLGILLLVFIPFQRRRT